MHNLCTAVNISIFAGTKVERDFVEMPSQMLENWIWEANITKRISKHYKTGVPLPDALIEKQLKRKTSHQGLELMHQIMLGTFDLLIHTALDT